MSETTASHCWCWENKGIACCSCDDDSEGEGTDATCPKPEPFCAGHPAPPSAETVELLRYVAAHGRTHAGISIEDLLLAAATEIEIQRSKVQSMGRIIGNVNDKNARLSRRIHTLNCIATGNPTPRIVRQIKEIRAAAGTNSVGKIVAVIEAAKETSRADRWPTHFGEFARKLLDQNAAVDRLAVTDGDGS